MLTKNAYIRYFCQTNPVVIGSAEQFYYNFTNVSGNKPAKRSSYGKENGGQTVLALKSNLSSLMSIHLKNEKSALYSDIFGSETGTIYGVAFGNGTDADSIDAYTMSGELFTTYNYTQTNTINYDANGITVTYVYTLTNIGSEDFTISEVGLLDTAYISKGSVKSYYLNSYLLERTLLETPITIPANNGVGQITYTIHMDYIDMLKGTIVS